MGVKTGRLVGRSGALSIYADKATTYILVRDEMNEGLRVPRASVRARMLLNPTDGDPVELGMVRDISSSGSGSRS